MSQRSFEFIWDRIVNLEGQNFETKTGKPFKYSIYDSTTIWVVRDGHRINQSLVIGNFEQVYYYMQIGPITGPGEINKIAISKGDTQVRGPAYVWALLHDHRVIQ